MTQESLKLALDALEEIALAGMSGTGQESERAMTEWHARQAWKFIGIAARQRTAIKEALREHAMREVQRLGQEIEQEPVAWVVYSSAENDIVWADKGKLLKQNTPLYTTPPQRTWVGLTDEDKAILEAVHRELDRDCYEGNAPGHSHRTKGVWDEDNGKLAGKPCAWCLTWAKFTTLIKNEAAHGIKEKNT